MTKTTFYQDQYTGWPPVKIAEFNDPDSYHWQSRALDMKHWLELKMGAEEFEAWAERLFPGDSIDQTTWKEIHELYEAKFRVIQIAEREECTCLPDLPDGRINGGRGTVCPVCAENRNDEIPIGG